MAYAQMREGIEMSSDAGTLEEEEEGFDEADLPGSVYGAAVFSMAYDITEVLTPTKHDDLPTELNLFRCVYALAMLGVNYVLQGMLLAYSYLYVVTPSVHMTQELYRTYHAEVFHTDGTFLPDKWEDLDFLTKKKICQIPFSKFGFTFLIIWIWAMVMVTELRETLCIISDIQSVEGTDKLSEVIHVVPGGRNHLRRLTPALRFSIHCFISLPKLVVNAGLYFIGTKWLAATPDFPSLILNSLALGFIIGVDELIYTTFLPKKMRSTVEETKFLVRSASLEEDIADRWASYRTSVLWFFASIASSVCYLLFSQLLNPKILPLAVLPGYKFDLNARCGPVIEKIEKNLCMFMDDPMNCFPYGKP
jgi:hypothetical protein